jgi:beta-RFAP synthase
VEGGKTSTTDLAPLIIRQPFPEAWRILLVRPGGEPRWFGERERQAFEQLALSSSPAMTDRLCRLVLLGLLPALVEEDFAAFSEALYEFNVRVGELFAPVQGGVYSDARTAGLVAWLRREGVVGVGQSSWGPTVFGALQHGERGPRLMDRLRQQFGPEVHGELVRGTNRGFRVEELTEENREPGGGG